MGVRGHLAPGAVRLFDCDFHLVVGQLLGTGLVTLREHAAGGKNLDYIHAIPYAPHASTAIKTTRRERHTPEPGSGSQRLLITSIRMHESI
jgi:hypothetical protein